MIRSRSNIERLRGDRPSLKNLCLKCGELQQLSMSMGGCLCHAFTDSKLKGTPFVKKAVPIKGNKSQRRKKRKASQAATRQQTKVKEVVYCEPSESIQQ